MTLVARKLPAGPIARHVSMVPGAVSLTERAAASNGCPKDSGFEGYAKNTKATVFSSSVNREVEADLTSS